MYEYFPPLVLFLLYKAQAAAQTLMASQRPEKKSGSPCIQKNCVCKISELFQTNSSDFGCNLHSVKTSLQHVEGAEGWDGEGGQWLLCPGCSGCTNTASQNPAGAKIPLLLAKKPPTNTCWLCQGFVSATAFKSISFLQTQN